MKLLPLILTIFLIHSFTIAQKVRVKSEEFFLGEAKPKAIALPTPRYPSDARGLGGVVSVKVVIDDKGKVTTENATGPRPVCPAVTDPKVLALRRVATEAALKATFEPARIDGKPVQANGWLKYDFQIDEKKSDAAHEKVEHFSATGGSIRGLLNGKAIALPR